MALSPIQGPTGPMMVVQYDPSALGTLHLDGKGGYRTAKTRGRYVYEGATLRFTTGDLAGWPVRYEVVRGAPTVRLAPSKAEKVSAKSRTGEHVCSCAAAEKPKASSPDAASQQPR